MNSPKLVNKNIPNILVIDDDQRLRQLISKYLREHNMIVVAVKSASEAREALKYLVFDLIILDVMMPQESGHEFLQDFRVDSELPVLMLTAMGESKDRIQGLELGADDYLPKPFEPKELLLRIEAILRRSKIDENVIKFGKYEFNTDSLSLKKSSQAFHLTSSELELIKYIAEKKGKTISREELAIKLGDIGDRAVDVQVMRLRKKIEDDPKKPVYIQTIRGEGYKLNVN